MSRRYRGYSSGPSWITAKYAGSCSRCKCDVAAGARVFWWPKYRVIECECCGRQSESEIAEENRLDREYADMCGGSTW